MDLIKIGRYIAEKRKEIGLTQKQLAEKLGMSDKSVSKWERGICLPDVSIYMELCDILNISINELLSGEGLQKTYVEKSEENFIELIKEKEIIKLDIKKLVILQIASVVLSIALWLILFSDSNIYQLGHVPTPLTLCYLVVGFISIYGTVSICGYGFLKKNIVIVFAAMSFASLSCLLICLGYQTFWLMIPAVTGVIVCFLLSIRNLFKNNK